VLVHVCWRNFRKCVSEIEEIIVGALGGQAG
jgi:hypothetical protein